MQNSTNKLHSTKLIISRKALKNNLQVYRGQLSESTGIMLMIKAFGYGSGDEQIAQYLEEEELLDYFGVAYINEGIALRKAGIKLPIMVMNPGIIDYQAIAPYNLELTIHCPEQLDQLLAQNSQNANAIKVHLKIDSGMHRLGFHLEEITAASEVLKKNHIEVVGAYTHLAATPNPEHDDFTHQQIAYFNQSYDLLAEGLGYKPMRHVLNSAGIIRFPEYHYDMVRAGMGVYGIDPAGIMQDKFQPISRFTTQISQINHLKKGDTVGYVRRGVIATDEASIAVLPVGYADGYNRLFSNGKAEVFINGKKAPIIGNVCMDMTFADITGIDCQVGDEVELFGPHISIQDLASAANSIDYEILTSISARVAREYV